MSFMVTSSSSCTHDEERFDTFEDSSFNDTNISVLFNPADDKLVLGKNEYYIKTVRLYAFDGNRLDNMTFKVNPTVTAENGVLVEMQVKQTSAKTLYAVINEPESMSGRLALINHPDAFTKMEFELADYFTTEAMAWNHNFDKIENGLPMFGKKENVNTIPTSQEGTIAVSFPVIRSLARVDVMVKKRSDLATKLFFDAESSISIINTYDKGMLAPGVINAEVLATKANVGKAQSSLEVPIESTTEKYKAERVYTFYTPERDCLTEGTKLKFTLHNLLWGSERKDFEVTINQSSEDGTELNKIERNKLYKIYCTFIKKETDITLSVEPWVNGYEGTFVTPIDIEFTTSRSKIEMDYTNQGNSFETSFYLYAKVNGDQVHNKPTYLDNKIYFDGYEHNGRKTIDGSNLPNWFKVRYMPDFPIESEAKVELYYEITDEKKYPVYLWFRVGNVKKRVQVIYDNGYLPKHLLDSGKYAWAIKQPAIGVQLTKRGNVLPNIKAHSEELKMQFSTNNNQPIGAFLEHGYGEDNTNSIIALLSSHNSVALKCRDLGQEWYLPSAYELGCVGSLQNYLGESYSYHISDSPIWSSSGSGDGITYVWVWGENPISKDYEIYGVQKTDDNIVRCIRNHY